MSDMLDLMFKMDLYPTGGIGNRIRVINSAVDCCERHKLRLVVHWQKNELLACDFKELFAEPQKFEVHESSVKGSAVILLVKLFRKLNMKSIKLLGMQFLFDIKDETNIPSGTSICLYNGHRFNAHSDWHLEYSDRVKAGANETLAKFLAGKTYGIHIRTTDNIQAIKFSPSWLFEEKMKSILKEEPGSVFFLCTDDFKLKESLVSKFGSSVLTRNNVLNRSTESGIIDAAVDMYCLSNTKKIYCSYYSSFSECAAELGKIEKEVLKLDEL